MRHIADSNESFVGKKISECKENSLYEKIAASLDKLGERQELRGNDGLYEVLLEEVPETNWIVASYVPKKLIYGGLTKLQNRIVIL